MKRILIASCIVCLISICLASESSDALKNIVKRSNNVENLQQIMCDTRMASINFKCSLEYRKLDLKNDIKVAKTEIMCENRLIDVKKKCDEVGEEICLKETEQLDKWCKNRFSEIKKVRAKSYKYIGEVCSNAVTELGKSCSHKKERFETKAEISESIESIEKPNVINETPLEEVVIINEKPEEIKVFTTKPELVSDKPEKTELSTEKLEKVEQYVEEPVEFKLSVDISDQIKPSTDKPKHLKLSNNDAEEIKLLEVKPEEPEQSTEKPKNLRLFSDDSELIKLFKVEPEQQEQSTEKPKSLRLSSYDSEKIKLFEVQPEQQEQSTEKPKSLRLSSYDSEQIKLSQVKPDKIEQTIEVDNTQESSVDKFKEIGQVTGELDRSSKDQILIKPEESVSKSQTQVDITYIFGESQHDIPRKDLKYFMNYLHDFQKRESYIKTMINYIFGDDQYKMKESDLESFTEILREMEYDFDDDNYKLLTPDLTDMYFSREALEPVHYSSLTPDEKVSVKINIEKVIVYVLGETKNNIQNSDMSNFLKTYMNSGRLNLMIPLKKLISDSLWQKSGLVEVPNTGSIIEFLFGSFVPKVEKIDLMRFIDKVADKRPYNMYFSMPVPIQRNNNQNVDALVNYMFGRIKHKLLKHGLGLLQNTDFRNNQKSNLETLIDYMLERYRHKIEKHNLLSLINPPNQPRRQYTRRLDFETMLSQIFKSHLSNLFPSSRIRPYRIGVFGWRQYNLYPGLYITDRKNKEKFIKKPIIVQPNEFSSSNIFEGIGDLLKKPNIIKPIMKPSSYKIQTIVGVQPERVKPLVSIMKPSSYKIQTIVGVQPQELKPLASPIKPIVASDNVNLLFYVIDSLVEPKPNKTKPLPKLLSKPFSFYKAPIQAILESPILKKNPLNISFVFNILDELINQRLPDKSLRPEDDESKLSDKDKDNESEDKDKDNSMIELFKGKSGKKPKLAMGYSLNLNENKKPLLASPQQPELLNMVDEIEVDDSKPEEIVEEIVQTIEPYVEDVTLKPTNQKVNWTSLLHIIDVFNSTTSLSKQLNNLTIEVEGSKIEAGDINGTKTDLNMTTGLNITITGSNINISVSNLSMISTNKSDRSLQSEKPASKLTTMASKVQVTTPNSKVTTLNSKVTTPNSKVTTLNSKVTTPNSKVTTLNSKVTTLNSKVTTPNSKVTTLNSKVTTPNSKVTTLNSKVTTPNVKETSIKVSTSKKPITESGFYIHEISGKEDKLAMITNGIKKTTINVGKTTEKIKNSLTTNGNSQKTSKISKATTGPVKNTTLPPEASKQASGEPNHSTKNLKTTAKIELTTKT